MQSWWALSTKMCPGARRKKGAVLRRDNNPHHNTDREEDKTSRWTCNALLPMEVALLCWLKHKATSHHPSNQHVVTAAPNFCIPVSKTPSAPQTGSWSGRCVAPRARRCVGGTSNRLKLVPHNRRRLVCHDEGESSRWTSCLRSYFDPSSFCNAWLLRQCDGRGAKRSTVQHFRRVEMAFAQSFEN
jgi:hypothetical protein